MNELSQEMKESLDVLRALVNDPNSSLTEQERGQWGNILASYERSDTFDTVLLDTGHGMVEVQIPSDWSAIPQ